MVLSVITTDGVRYSSAELIALARFIGVRSFPGVDDTDLGYSAVGREAALASARGSLLAREVIDLTTPGQPRLAPPNGDLLATATQPGLVITARIVRGSESETRLYYVTPQRAVEHSLLSEGLHRLRLMRSEDLLLQVLAFLGLEERPMGSGDLIRVSPRVSELLGTATWDQVDEALGRDVPEALRAALRDELRYSFARCLYRDGERFLGGEVAWIDGGPAGLWAVDTPVSANERQGEDTAVEIRPVEALTLGRRLLDYLPGSGVPAN